MRFEKKRNCVLLFRVYTIKKKFKILELVFYSSRHILFESFLCVRVLLSSGSSCSNDEQKMKYVVVSGGVVSGLGKGVTASSVGRRDALRGGLQSDAHKNRPVHKRGRRDDVAV